MMAASQPPSSRRGVLPSLVRLSQPPGFGPMASRVSGSLPGGPLSGCGRDFMSLYQQVWVVTTADGPSVPTG